MKLFNVILTRGFIDCNYWVLKFWYANNRYKLEENFYNSNILMSGAMKKTRNDVVEILYLKYFAEKELSIVDVFNIYNMGNKIFPDYNQFISNYQVNSEKDIVNMIIKRITHKSEIEVINREDYNSMCNKIYAQLQNSFSASVLHKPIDKIKLVEVQERLEEKELAFIGIYFSVEYQDLNGMLCYKLLEKIFGSNDANGVYYLFRERGWIYTGLSGFVIENNIFYTGAIMQYDLEHEAVIKKAIEEFEFCTKEFEEAKKMLLDDFRYTKFQYGETFALLPYNLQIADVGNFEMCVQDIEEDEVREKQKQICLNGFKLRMKVI